MSKPRRQRITNGVPRDEVAKSYFCKYGRHYVYPSTFLQENNNRGVCLDCAFDIHQLLYGVMETLPVLSTKEIIRLRNQWQENRDYNKAVDRIRQGSNDPGWVYYVAQADLIKVGYASDVTKRIKAYGPTAELMAVHPGTPLLEKQMHAKFKGSLERGREWFRRDDELMEHIAGVVKQFGSAEVFEYQWTRPKTEEEKVRGLFDTQQYGGLAAGIYSLG